MKKNMGGIDRIIRFMAVAILAFLLYTNNIQGMLAFVLISFAGIFLATSFISFCPLYSLLGLNSCKLKNKD
jgi:hypothetical protein